MDDQLLKDRLRQAAELAAGEARLPAQRKIRRRAWVRQGRLLVGVAAFALAVVVGVNSLGPQLHVVTIGPPGGEAQRRIDPSEYWTYRDAHPTGPIVIVTEGERSGWSWRLDGFQSKDNAICWALYTVKGPGPAGPDTSGSGTSACGPNSTRGPSTMLVGAAATFSVFSGPVSKRVARVVVILHQGRVETTPITVPDLPVNFYLVPVPKQPTASLPAIRQVQWLDDQGQLVCRHPWPGHPGRQYCPPD